ncbi:amidohydrolase family protein [Kaistia dalseonensis]|uniref:Cytosine/adenosine deaminase-related metal-dependent hydrolase n=1 Tax=Kaistia dalseonensis TaxID=410840 RepID=A0ABU0HBZ7_9HYPH|nr:amidohydrolase family protein [Kaistia dalseonensis]MCX5497203.1 amidohydrolase family protein [Kaistia dalseonensis]MDQ0439834.1 cytosine/adenosine deaminase-related metal-dependent hydrolase [Kaistia dalseonensis]
MQPDLVIAGARSPEGALVDVVVTGETIAAILPAGSSPEGGIRIDGTNKLVAPSFVEGHIHLDKTLLGLPFIPHIPGNTVALRIAAEKELRRTVSLSVEERGGRLIEQIAAFGTGSIRSHVDIDSEVGLKGLHAELALKERYADLVDIQIVAFPQSGVMRDPGVADLLDAAMLEGADLVGGLDPAGIDDDVTGHLDAIFAVAEKHGVGLDIHLHDPGPLGAFELRQIAARTIALGLEGRVAVSHAFALGQIDDFEFGRTAEALATARVAIMTNGPGPVSMPPVKRLEAAGVTVFAGSDNIRDAWSPYGNGDPLQRAMIIGYRQEFNADEDLAHAFAMVTALPAAVIGLSGYGLAAGNRADLILIPALSIPEAVSGVPGRRTVIKRGKVVATDGVLSPRV